MVQLRAESDGSRNFEIPDGSDRRRAVSLAPRPTEAEGLLRRRVLDAQGDALLRRAHVLDPDDRALLEALLREGESPLGAAKSRGVSTRTVRRRLRRLINRMASERFLFVLAQHLSWPLGRRRVGEACVLRGRSMRAAARELGLSVHAVRRHLAVVSAMYQAATEMKGQGVGGAPAARVAP